MTNGLARLFSESFRDRRAIGCVNGGAISEGWRSRQLTCLVMTPSKRLSAKLARKTSSKHREVFGEAFLKKAVPRTFYHFLSMSCFRAASKIIII
ncbi:hypothetical protein [Komagataeibacter xylinus]|uniref:hypothetical protein n=1 Tax=Komagataeibacter xylinus TaxID=28448 RepID=UPI0012E97428|nr:hypothetical protein [Komagataeibacter xylinus]